MTVAPAFRGPPGPVPTPPIIPRTHTQMEDFEADNMLDEIEPTLSCEGLFEEFAMLFSDIKEKQSPLFVQNRLNAVISR